MVTIGAYRHRVFVEIGTPVPDGKGGFATVYAPATPPEWECSLTPATPRDMETVTAGTVLAQATHVARGRYHPGLTTGARLVLEETDEWGTSRTHVLNVTAIVNVDFRRMRSEALVAEVIA